MDTAAALVNARRRAGLSQSELARRTGTAQPAIARIEGRDVVPRVDTLARLLEACGASLVVARRLGANVDRGPIRELLRKEPLQRIWGSRLRAERILGVLTARHVRCVVIGEAAEVIQGSPAAADTVELVVAGDRMNRKRLDMAIERLRTWRINPVGKIRWRFRPPAGSPSFDELERAADGLTVGKRTVRIASLDDLIEMRRALTGRRNRDRLDLLWAVREERARRSARPRRGR
jgi:transcriptional regulator with XRE-family HTH domain